jgi:hypothetical protein
LELAENPTVGTAVRNGNLDASKIFGAAGSGTGDLNLKLKIPMNQKLLVVFLGACAAGIVPLRAQTDAASPAAAAAPSNPPAPAPAAVAAPAAPALSVILTPSYVSQYMFRGQRLGGQSFEPSVEADYGNWALGVWSNIPLSDKVPGQSDPEIDPYGSYTYSVTDSFNLQPGFTVYTYTKAPTDQGFYRSTFEPNFAVNYTIGGLKITPKLYYDVILRGLTSELSAGYVVPLKPLGTEFDFTGTIGNYLLHDAANNTDPHVKAAGNYWLLGVSLPFQLDKATKFVAGWAYTEGTGAYLKQGTFPRVDNSEAVGRGVATASLVYTF